MKNIPFILLILILVLIPFFWFKPGEVNLGGDSSRLYFYDPIHYLINFPLYNIAPGEIGSENVSYFFIPFTLLLVLVKTVIHSTGIVINLFNSMMLVFSFLFTYLTIVEFLKYEGKENNWLRLAGIIGGIVYIFAPMVNNWDKALITHNQLFLNPLMFYLFLRFVHTNKTYYLLIALFITVIFAPNFSFASAPNFFAFYPIVLLFLSIYAIYIRKVTVRIKTIFAALFLLFVLHAFQLIPLISMLSDTTSNLHERVFASNERPNIGFDTNLTNNILGIVQGAGLSSVFSFIFLAVIIGGFLTAKKRSKTFFLISAFMLITLFFDTGKITKIGMTFYRFLFLFVPGFGMFRNFYGQFLYVFFFFYSLTFAYSFYFLSLKIKKNILYIVTIFVFSVLCMNGWAFIKGDMVNLPVFGAKDIKVPFTMDPAFEKVLEDIRHDPVDGKYLTLPLGFYGYQLLSGTEGGLYIGPSMIGYLGGKKDFPGYSGLSSYGDLFFSLMSMDDYKDIEMLLSWLNIRYIFHNEDPKIYDSFSQFPYAVGYTPGNTANYGIKRFFPTQGSIDNFIANISAKKVSSAGLYTIYKTNEYLPHIYAAKKNIYAQNFNNDWRFPPALTENDLRVAFYEKDTAVDVQKETAVNVKRKGLITDISRIPYEVSLLNDGQYEVYIKQPLLSELNSGSLRIESNNQVIAPLKKPTRSGWMQFENLTYSKKDGNTIPLVFIMQDYKPAGIKLLWQKISQQGLYSLTAPIERIDPKRQYLLSFQYNTNGQAILLRLLEDQVVKEGKKMGVLLDQNIGSQGISQFQSLLTIDPFTTSAQIQLIAGSEELLISGIKDFTLVPAYQPEIVLRKVTPVRKNEDIPHITFTKINPTKYIVSVRNANDPYSLVFLEAFNKNWKLFLADSKLFGQKDEVVASYFNGEIQEGTHRNSFIDTKTFETFGKTPIADKKHTITNGYANSWNISPIDVGGKKNYELIIEMTSQRLFYIGLLISLGGVVLYIVWCVIEIRSKKRT